MIVVIYKLKKEDCDKCHVLKSDRVTCYKEKILEEYGVGR